MSFRTRLHPEPSLSDQPSYTVDLTLPLAATLLHEGAAILRGGFLGAAARVSHHIKNTNEVVSVRARRPSSGIGQLQAPAARTGLEHIGIFVDRASDYDLLSNLTFDDRLSVFAVGGYLGYLKAEDQRAGGRADDRALFIMYSVDLNVRNIMRNDNYRVSSVEARGGLVYPGVLIARERYWAKVDQAVREAGF